MRFSLITLALAFSLPLAASATTYNVVTDFSSTSNPNGVWTYGYGSGATGTFIPFTSSASTFLSAYGLTIWSNGDQLPAVGHTAGTTYGTVDIPSNYLFLHPGDQSVNGDAIVLFTAPTTGEYYVDGSFTHLDDANAGTGQYVNILYDGVGGPGVLLGTNYGSSAPFSGTVGLYAGDTLWFDVAKNRSFDYDSTGLQLTVANAPEPSGLVLLGTGILGLAGAARRKLRS